LTAETFSTDNRLMLQFTIWLPEMARKEPENPILLAYQVPAGAQPLEIASAVAEAFRHSKLTAVRTGEWKWRAILPWQTRVFGIIPRDVDENVTVQLVHRPDLWELILHCQPVETHAAHATGVAAVLFIAASVWIATGLVAGLAAAATTILAGALLVEVTRQWAFDALERRIRRLAGDIGSALWPGSPAQIVSND
jgi:hypothetical protein